MTKAERRRRVRTGWAGLVKSHRHAGHARVKPPSPHTGPRSTRQGFESFAAAQPEARPCLGNPPAPCGAIFAWRRASASLGQIDSRRIFRDLPDRRASPGPYYVVPLGRWQGGGKATPGDSRKPRAGRIAENRRLAGKVRTAANSRTYPVRILIRVSGVRVPPPALLIEPNAPPFGAAFCVVGNGLGNRRFSRQGHSPVDRADLARWVPP